MAYVIVQCSFLVRRLKHSVFFACAKLDRLAFSDSKAFRRASRRNHSGLFTACEFAGARWLQDVYCELSSGGGSGCRVQGSQEFDGSVLGSCWGVGCI